MSKLNKKCIDCLRTLIILGIITVIIKELLNYVKINRTSNIKISTYKRHVFKTRFIVNNRTKEFTKKLKYVDDHFRDSENVFKEMMSNYYIDYDEYYRPMLTRAFNYRPFTKAITVRDIEPECDGKPFLLIQIHSAAININKRLAIRHSWGRYVTGLPSKELPSSLILTTFVVGRSMVNSINLVIRREGEQYKDVLFNNVVDSYESLTNKSVAGLTWASNKCRPTYLLKTDDDCYVNIPNVIKFLKTRTPEDDLYAGRVLWYRLVDRDEQSEFYTTKEAYGKPLYPPYASGSGYILSGHILPKILERSRFHNQVPSEDAYLGIIIASLHIPVMDHKKILPYIFCNETVWDRPSCDFVNPLVMYGVFNYAQIWIHYHVKILSIVSGICKHSTRNRKNMNIPLYCYAYEDLVVLEKLRKLRKIL